MRAVAHVSHATRGRARLRLPSEKGDCRLFDRIAHVLRQCEAVTDVRVNASTGSVLISFRGDLAEVTAYARAQDLFDVEERPPTGDPLERLRASILRANAAMHDRTGGSADLKTIAIAALLGGSAYQLVRGYFLPPGGTMLMQALDLLFSRQHRID